MSELTDKIIEHAKQLGLDLSPYKALMLESEEINQLEYSYHPNETIDHEAGTYNLELKIMGRRLRWLR